MFRPFYIHTRYLENFAMPSCLVPRSYAKSLSYCSNCEVFLDLPGLHATSFSNTFSNTGGHAEQRDIRAQSRQRSQPNAYLSVFLNEVT